MFTNTGKMIEAAGASAVGSLNISGTVVEENGTLLVGALSELTSGHEGVLGMINATVDISGPIGPDVFVGLMGSSHLGLSVGLTFLSPVALASQQATIDLRGVQSFADITINPKTDMVDFISKSGVVFAALQVIDDVPHTALSASYNPSTETVTLGLFHH